MNYIMNGIVSLKYGVLFGVAAYIVIMFFLYILNIRRNISWKCLVEVTFCIYAVTLLKTTDIFALDYSLNGIFSYNSIPFTESSIIPVMLNFILFVPYGFLLPFVFSSCKWNWKRIVITGALTSFVIELLQMFGGRYAEIDDFLINTFGAFSGYIIYVCIHELKKNRKRAATYLLTLCASLIIVFTGIYVVGDNESQSPDGLYAVESNIAQINVYSGAEECKVEVDSEVYHCFAIQISNCGGHVLDPRSIAESEIWNDNDCFIEIIYSSPQTIVFENSADFSISNTDRILYNADQNILYWGNSHYQNCLDYTALTDELQEHRNEILEGYERLRILISECFLKNVRQCIPKINHPNFFTLGRIASPLRLVSGVTAAFHCH